MARLELPGAPQPDPVPPITGPTVPSLITYATLLIASIALIAASFAIRADWPGLMINLGSSFISSVIMLIFIDQRLRTTELDAIRLAPAQVGLSLELLIRPRRRRLYRFVRAQLIALERGLSRAINPTSMMGIIDREEGFLLIGPPGTGKTTILQLLCAARSRGYLADRSLSVPIFFPMRSWIGRQALEDAIGAHVATFYPISRKQFLSVLASQKFLFILDGLDEMVPQAGFDHGQAIADFHQRFPEIELVISACAIPPALATFDQITLPSPSQAEIEEILRRRT